MKTLTFTEFRKRASEVLDLVERGETVRVLRHGKPVARIVPDDSDDGVPAWKRPRRRLVLPPGVSLTRIILEERESSL